ncbi:hypothetical protein HDU96_005050 [Phlyctochytrium bullatum]|nr:hypothetical protein HDU96_005050 [Phlyctochytrium bullatum]
MVSKEGLKRFLLKVKESFQQPNTFLVDKTNPLGSSSSTSPPSTSPQPSLSRPSDPAPVGTDIRGFSRVLSKSADPAYPHDDDHGELVDGNRSRAIEKKRSKSEEHFHGQKLPQLVLDGFMFMQSTEFQAQNPDHDLHAYLAGSRSVDFPRNLRRDLDPIGKLTNSKAVPPLALMNILAEDAGHVSSSRLNSQQQPKSSPSNLHLTPDQVTGMRTRSTSGRCLKQDIIASPASDLEVKGMRKAASFSNENRVHFNLEDETVTSK